LKKEFILLGIIISVAISITPAFADNAQVYITNNTSTRDCAYTPSCFLPYQVSISVGDTVTWTNLDNKTHTVTTGTTNYGAVGNFDSGSIQSHKSFTQFFGTIGKYRYFDKTNTWVIGIVIVENGKPTHAELAWLPNSLKTFDQFGNMTSTPIFGNPLTITKDVYNSGGTDATSIMFRLKIKNGTNYLVYDNIVKVNIGAKQTVPIGFSWLPEKPGTYQLFFEADPSNSIGDTNAYNDIAFDSLIISNGTHSVSGGVFSTSDGSVSKFDNNTSSVPEFGPLVSLVLTASLIPIIVLFSKRIIHN
jgi:plastocyanin